jgi:nicotinate-nucleotide adenylyltransferase
MLRLAVAGESRFKICTMELNRVGNTYTIDTIASMRARLGENAGLYFIIGWDKVPELPEWKDISRLIEMCRLVAVPRPGYSLPDMDRLEEAVPGVSGSIVFLDAPLVDISASGIRRRLAQGQDIAGLVPAAVADYIRGHALYAGD